MSPAVLPPPAYFSGMKLHFSAMPLSLLTDERRSQPCNIALMVKRDLRWDPKGEQFVDDEAANQLLSRASRPGFTA